VLVGLDLRNGETIMPRKRTETTTARHERFLRAPRQERFVLRLDTSGATPASTRAVANLRKLCEEDLQGRYELDVIDVFQQPELAKGAQIIATPTLIRQFPPPLRRFIGDLDGLAETLLAFQLQPTQQAPED
jgi:circadian clock protein KaiB